MKIKLKGYDIELEVDDSLIQRHMKTIGDTIEMYEDGTFFVFIDCYGYRKFGKMMETEEFIKLLTIEEMEEAVKEGLLIETEAFGG